MLDVKNYIENEINFIERYESQNKKSLNYLNKLTNKDIKTIQQQVNDDEELNQYINETINYYLYHYKNDLRGGIKNYEK